jgi:gas vesicle protein
MNENTNRNGSDAGATVTPEATFEVPAATEPSGHGLGFFFGVVAGALVGAGLATILTPVSGDQARTRTAEKAPEMWHRREELAREARDKAREISGSVRSRLEEALESSREAAQEAQQEARRRFEEMTGRRSSPPYP